MSSNNFNSTVQVASPKVYICLLYLSHRFFARSKLSHNCHKDLPRKCKLNPASGYKSINVCTIRITCYSSWTTAMLFWKIREPGRKQCATGEGWSAAKNHVMALWHQPDKGYPTVWYISYRLLIYMKGNWLFYYVLVR